MYTESFATFLLIALVAANPINKRATGSIAKEFSQGGCKDVLFAFARGSTEIGNMVSLQDWFIPLCFAGMIGTNLL